MLVIQKRLTLPHSYDVRYAAIHVGLSDENLPNHFPGTKVAREAFVSGSAEVACHSATYLR